MRFGNTLRKKREKFPYEKTQSWALTRQDSSPLQTNSALQQTQKRLKVQETDRTCSAVVSSLSFAARAVLVIASLMST